VGAANSADKILLTLDQLRHQASTNPAIVAELLQLSDP